MDLPFAVEWSKAKQTIINGKQVVRVPIDKNVYLVLFKGANDSLNVFTYAYAPDKNAGKDHFTGGVVSFSFQDWQLRGQIFKDGISSQPFVFESKYDAMMIKNYLQSVHHPTNPASPASSQSPPQLKVNSIFGDIFHTIGNIFGALGCTMTGGSWSNGPGGSWSNDTYGSWGQSCSGQVWNWNFSGGYGANDPNAPSPDFVLSVFDAASGYTYTFDKNHMDPGNPIVSGNGGAGSGGQTQYADYGTADRLTAAIGLSAAQRSFLISNYTILLAVNGFWEDATTYKNSGFGPYYDYPNFSEDKVKEIIQKHVQLLMTDANYLAFYYTFRGPRNDYNGDFTWWDQEMGVGRFETYFLDDPSHAATANINGYLAAIGLESDPSANQNGETNDETVGGYDQTDYGIYQQGNSWPTVNPVINYMNFVMYNGENCMKLAKRQLVGAGYQISGYDALGQTYNINTYNGGIDINQAKVGVAYMKGALQAGIPVIVGIDYMNGVPVNTTTGKALNPDLTTDHFVVIVGMGTDAEGKFFRFYDSATKARLIGTSANNKLYYNETTGVISGTTEVAFARALQQGTPMYRNANGKVIYTITHIRRSKTL